jgi:hypothetical protein
MNTDHIANLQALTFLLAAGFHICAATNAIGASTTSRAVPHPSLFAVPDNSSLSKSTTGAVALDGFHHDHHNARCRHG